MPDFLETLFTSDFMPHGHCYLWRPDLLWLHAVSDSLIAAAYFTIPILLVYFVRKRRDLAFKWMFVMFGAFILACGTTHVMEVWTIWHGTYYLSGFVKLSAGVISVSTAMALVPLVPRALELPSPRALRRANKALRHEIEARRKVEQALRESEERFRRAFDDAGIGKAIVSPEGRWQQVNPALCRILGYSAEELLQRPVQEVTCPDDASGDPIAHALASEAASVQMEKRYCHREGAAVWVLVNVSTIRDEAGQALYLIQEVQDVTERKEAERALVRSNRTLELRNRELQEFAYVASHDMQEPLRKVATFTELVQHDYGSLLDETGLFYLDRVKDSAVRMSELLRGLLSYSRITTHGKPFEPVDLNETVASVLADLELAISEAGAQVKTELLPVIEADPVQMRQLLQNLIGNAVKFRKAEGPAVVEIGADGCAGKDEDGREVCRLQVRDNGIGFEAAYQDKIFLPFERLHGRSAYPGMGMGLAICRRIAERHGGAITVESTPGEGAAFTVTLPVRHG